MTATWEPEATPTPTGERFAKPVPPGGWFEFVLVLIVFAVGVSLVWR